VEDRAATTTLDLTDLVRAWLAGEHPDHGVVLIGHTDGPAVLQHCFLTSEHPTYLGARPRIVARYRERVPHVRPDAAGIDWTGAGD
jgi:hypothetical protein